MIPLVLLVLGGVLCAPYAVRVLGASINREAFETVLRKLLSASNGSRALKLTKAAAASPLAGAIESALVVCRDGTAVPDRESADYRSGALDRSPDAVMARVRTAYDRGFVTTARPLVVARRFAIVGMLLTAAFLVVVALGVEAIGATSIIGALVLLIVLNSLRIERRMIRDAQLLLDSVADVMYRAAVEPDAFFGADRLQPPAPEPSDSSGLASLAFDIYEPGSPLRREQLTTPIVKIGRLPTAHVVLGAAGVDRMHAVIERTRDETAIIDLGSRAGTLVNGARVNKRALIHGDVISIGEAELRVALG